MREPALEQLESVDDMVDPLGSRDAVNQVHARLPNHQLAVLGRMGDLKSVTQHPIDEARSAVRRV